MVQQLQLCWLLADLGKKSYFSHLSLKTSYTFEIKFLNNVVIHKVQTGSANGLAVLYMTLHSVLYVSGIARSEIQKRTGY